MKTIQGPVTDDKGPHASRKSHASACNHYTLLLSTLLSDLYILTKRQEKRNEISKWVKSGPHLAFPFKYRV